MKRIALLLGQDLGYCRDVMRGIQAYASGRLDWIFRDAPPDPHCLGPLREWRPHGIIAHLFLPEMVAALRQLRRPVVNTTSALADCDLPLIEADHLKVGHMAADYFLKRGYTSFGYFGSKFTDFSFEREKGFRVAVEQAGCSVSSCFADYLPRQRLDSSWKSTDRSLQQWLRKLKKPVAIFTSHDVAARDVGDACLALKLKVPQQVALLGVDNDEVVCRLARPALSSVQIPAEQIGYRAAQILDRMMAGKKPPVKALFLPPVRVVTRQSTDVTAVDDPVVRSALAFIQAHFSTPIGVKEVCEGIGIGRRALERRMASLLGRTVLQELQRARVESAQQMLLESDLAIDVVAARTGFTSARRFSDVFREQVGVTAGQYRRRHVLHTGARRRETSTDGAADVKRSSGNHAFRELRNSPRR